MSSSTAGYLLSAAIILWASIGLMMDNRQYPIHEAINICTYKDKGMPEGKNYSCPLIDPLQTIITYPNDPISTIYPDLTVNLAVKRTINHLDYTDEATIFIDAVVYQRDKKTNNVIRQYFSNPHEELRGHIYDGTYSSEFEVMRIPLDKDCYYQLQIFKLQVFNSKYYSRIVVDRYKSGRYLVNAFMWPSPITTTTRLTRYQIPIFTVAILLTIVFAYRLLVLNTRQLFNLRSLLVLAYSISVVLYVFPLEWQKHLPEPILALLPSFSRRYLAYFFIAHFALDSMIVYTKYLYWKYLCIFILFWVDVLMTVFRAGGILDTVNVVRPFDYHRDRDDACPAMHRNSRALSSVKKYIYIGMMILNYNSFKEGNNKWRIFYLPLVLCGIWNSISGASEIPIRESEMVNFKLHVDYGCILITLIVLQALVFEPSSIKSTGYTEIPNKDPSQS